MVDLAGMFRRARSKGQDLAKSAPDRARDAAKAAPGEARRYADEARRTGRAVGEVLDERTDGRFGAAVSKGGEVADKVKAKPGEIRDAFKDGDRDGYRPDRYRPDPIDAPAPIDRPDPI